MMSLSRLNDVEEHRSERLRHGRRRRDHRHRDRLVPAGTTKGCRTRLEQETFFFQSNSTFNL